MDNDGTVNNKFSSRPQMVKLYPDQQALEQKIHAAWAKGHRNVLAVLPTGGGKTVIFSKILADEQVPSIAIAHRQELVAQISLALARNGVRHRIIGPESVAQICRRQHISELQKNYIEPGAAVAVAGVDTLVRLDGKAGWMKQIKLVVQDEAHHVLKVNKWGVAAGMFPNAKMLGVTATPVRADGKGLGRHVDGLFHILVEGPTMRELIDRGRLTEYRIFAPVTVDLNLGDVPISAGGDFSPQKLAVAVHKSHIVGDVVKSYERFANGKLGVTFAVDVQSATEIAKAYRDAGIPAEVVTAETDPAYRAAILRKFRNRQLLQLVNVDLFGEGFDLPAIEVVSMARPTQSFSLYCQQFGRALRLLEGKTHAIVIDHVGNVIRHGLPDAPRVWTLDGRDRRASSKKSDVVPVRTCVKCVSAYEAYLIKCPYCGNVPEPAARSTPEAVDGDLAELDFETLARMRGEVLRGPTFPHGASPAIVGKIGRAHV